MRRSGAAPSPLPAMLCSSSAKRDEIGDDAFHRIEEELDRLELGLEENTRGPRPVARSSQPIP
jgi:hypothetical protein